MFLEKLLHAVPKLGRKIVELDAVDFLKAIIYKCSTIVLVGKFVHDVLEIFYATHVYRTVHEITERLIPGIFVLRSVV